MKKTILFLALINLMLTSSCGDKEENFTPSDTELGAIKSLLPLDQFEQNTIAVFKNKNGVEKPLNISTKLEIIQKNINNVSYQSESLHLIYKDADDASFNITVTASSEINDQQTPTEIINCSLSPSNSSVLPNIPLITIDTNGNTRAGQFHESDILLNINFDQVFLSNIYDTTNQNEYEDLYYTTELGIIGFLDGQDTFWVFTRFE